MITFKCKMCGGDLRPEDGATTCECEYCGSVQTIPTADNEKKGNLFNRANRLRMAAEYDKAASVYASITAEFPEEAEAYWGLVLCKYGIEYVDDPGTGRKIPTCHRTLPDSIMDDPDFDQACEYADGIARRVYRDEAKAIDRLQRDILSVVANESPYDVFICYKETGEDGGRTEDSVLGQDIYDALTAKGLKVFFARITLEDKLGQQYEPYIYAALHSAKVMLSIGTQYEYFDAVWVKNEWARFLDMMRTDKAKTLIPCYKGIDAYDMPREFKNLQAQDMGKLGWLQDLTRGVMKLCGKEETRPQVTQVVQQVVQAGNPTVDSLLKRAYLFLEDGEWDNADQYAEKVLDLEPANGQAYFVKLLVEQKLHTADELGKLDTPFDSAPLYAKVMRFGDDALKAKVSGYINAINTARTEREQAKRMSDLKKKLNNADTMEKVFAIRNGLKPYGNAEGLEALRRTCNQRAAEVARLQLDSISDLEALIKLFSIIEQLHQSDERQQVLKAYSEKVLACARRKAFQETDPGKLSAMEAQCKGYMDEDSCNALHALCTKITTCLESIAKIKADFKARQTEWQAQHTKIQHLSNEREQTQFIRQATAQHILSLQEEIRNLRGLFSGKRRRELEEAVEKEKQTLREIDTKLSDLEARLTKAKQACPEPVDERELTYRAAKAWLDEGLYEPVWPLLKTIRGYKDVDSIIENDDTIAAAAAAWRAQFKVGNTVQYGRYEQDNDATNGAEAIEWIVLANDGETATLISKYALDAKPYNTEKKDVTWETCTLRNWLNGVFLNTAFIAEERTRLKTVTVTADKNPQYDTDPGNDTQDKVFLLSIDEANRYFDTKDARVCMPTKYAVAHRPYADKDSGACWWWLRSPGLNCNHAAFVFTYGSVHNLGNYVNLDFYAVRPVVVLRL